MSLVMKREKKDTTGQETDRNSNQWKGHCSSLWTEANLLQSPQEGPYTAEEKAEHRRWLDHLLQPPSLQLQDLRILFGMKLMFQELVSWLVTHPADRHILYHDHIQSGSAPPLPSNQRPSGRQKKDIHAAIAKHIFNSKKSEYSNNPTDIWHL